MFAEFLVLECLSKRAKPSENSWSLSFLAEMFEECRLKRNMIEDKYMPKISCGNIRVSFKLYIEHILSIFFEAEVQIETGESSQIFSVVHWIACTSNGLFIKTL